MEDNIRDIGVVLTEIYEQVHNKQEIAAKMLLEGKACKDCDYLELQLQEDVWCPFRPEKPEGGVCPLFRWRASKRLDIV